MENLNLTDDKTIIIKDILSSIPAESKYGEPNGSVEEMKIKTKATEKFIAELYEISIDDLEAMLEIIGDTELKLIIPTWTS